MRAWEPDKKCWLIASSWVNRVRRLLEQAFGPCRIETPAGGTGSAAYEPTPIRPSDAALRTLHLLPSAPPALIESAYRCLARVHHPDAGGDTEAMRNLNAAIATLRGYERDGVAS
ncbi:MAG: J domain-containing protein [Chloroflexota bacterium]|nr:J domain-containing protein [Chloroflexota bacterium]